VAAETRACPYCAEQIRTEAIKCRWCGQSLVLNPVVRPAQPRVALDPGGTAILVIAIIGWVIWCTGIVLHPVAWAMGAAYESDCRARGVEPNGAGKAGRMLGMIGTLIYGAVTLFVILLAVAGGMK
jgi:hypothetical protein